MRDKGGIGMISLELARKLKEAGLIWEPQMYDFFTMIIFEKPIIICVTDKWTLDSVRKEVLEFKGERRLFLPRLDQLLAEIEKLGYHDFYLSRAEEGWHICLWLPGNENLYPDLETDYYDTPTDAAASALLWILEGGAGHEQTDRKAN